MIDRLCTLADMPKPRVGIADTSLPNAFATGRSPQRSVVVVTTGILQRLDAEELEGVLAHELSHVAHRDVLVMTVASSAGIMAGMLTRGAQYGAIFGGGRRDNNNGGIPVWLLVLVVSLVVYAVSFVLLKLLSRYRELSADRAGAYLTMKPEALASALQKITGDINTIPERDLRATQRDERLLHRPRGQGCLAAHAHLDAPHPRAAPRAAREDPGRARPSDGLTWRAEMGFWDVVTGRTKPKQANLDALFLVPERRDHARDHDRADADRRRARSATARPPARRSPHTQDEVVELLNADPEAPDVQVTQDEFGFTWLVAAPRPERRDRALHRPARGQHRARGARASVPGCSAP